MSVVIPNDPKVIFGRSTTDSDGVASIEFPEEYPSTPEVFIQPRGTTASIPVFAKVTSLSTTGFSIIIHKWTGSTMAEAANQTFSWLAAGSRT